MQKQSSTLSTESLVNPKLLWALTERIIPWIEQSGISRVVLAQSPLTAVALPEQVRVSQRRLLDSAIKLRGPGAYSKVVIRWPKDGLHAFRFPHFLFVVEGEADLSIGTEVIHCPQGYGILAPPGTPLPDGSRPHWERPDSLQSAYSDIFWACIWPLGVELNLCHTRGDTHKDVVPGEYCFVANRQLHQIVERFLEELIQPPEGFETIASHYLLLFLLLLHRDLQNEEGLPGRVFSHPMQMEESNSLATPRTTVILAKDYIHAHLGGPLTLEIIARAAYTSRANLARLFRTETGLTV